MGSPASIFDSLYCSEEHWVDDALDDHLAADNHFFGSCDNVYGGEGLVQGLFWDEEELVSLSSKEETPLGLLQSVRCDRPLELERARAEAVEWMMKSHSYHGFSALAAVLAVNYLDRFLTKFHRKTDDQGRSLQQPWMTQLTAVACLSLAAKVEETHVPLLLDLQVDESRDLFDANTVRKMELLVLSTLQWRMNPVTPLSFLDHFARRLGMQGLLCRDFIRQSELVLLHVIQDPRFLRYLPSATAAAVMLHVIDSFDPRKKAYFLDQSLDLLRGMEKDVVDECSDLVSELASQARMSIHPHSSKRKFGAMTAGSIPGSPCGVVEVCFSCPSSDSECSSDAWSVVRGVGPTSYLSEPLPKKKPHPPQD